ncbi:MAG: DNA glycosylase AlkZ-like family protein [Parabacteroides merdae]
MPGWELSKHRIYVMAEDLGGRDFSLKSSSLRVVDDALAKGEILRTHMLRPTWHFIVAEDIRWMLQLSGGRIRTAFDSYARSPEDGDDTASTTKRFVEDSTWSLLLGGNKSLTKRGVDGWVSVGQESRQTIAV